jgi:hypothetical protein
VIAKGARVRHKDGLFFGQVAEVEAVIEDEKELCRLLPIAVDRGSKKGYKLRFACLVRPGTQEDDLTLFRGLCELWWVPAEQWEAAP